MKVIEIKKAIIKAILGKTTINAADLGLNGKELKQAIVSMQEEGYIEGAIIPQGDFMPIMDNVIVTLEGRELIEE